MSHLNHLFPDDNNEALKLYLTVFDTNPNGIFIYDEQNNLIDCNETACKMHGFTKEQMLNMRPDEFIHPDGYAAFLKFKKFLQSYGEFHGESCGLTKDGKKFYVEVWGKRIHFNGVNYHFSTIKDITTQKKTLERLSQQEKELERKVQQRTKELEEALKSIKVAQRQIMAQEKLATLGSLIAGIAHEIKNPLNLIINASSLVSEILTSKFSELDQEKFNSISPAFRNDLNAALEMSAMILKNAERADKIIHGLLNQARSKIPQVEPTNIAQLVRDTLNLAYQAAKRKNSFRLQMDLQLEEVGEVMIFPHEFSRALINIFENSFYAQLKKLNAREGTKYHPKILVRLEKNKKKCQLTIRDNGIGIPDYIKDKIFQPFYTTKPAGEGTGLGMAIVKDIIVQLHEGNLEIEGQAGEYTEVRIQIPMNLKKR